MPLPKGTRFRFRTLSSGEKQRLAFQGSKVIEVKGYKKQKGKARGYVKKIN